MDYLMILSCIEIKGEKLSLTFRPSPSLRANGSAHPVAFPAPEGVWPRRGHCGLRARAAAVGWAGRARVVSPQRRSPQHGPAMPPPGQTQLPDWDGLKLRVRTLIATHRVMIFSKSYCPYCHRVRERGGASLLLGPTQPLPFLAGWSMPVVRPPGEAGSSGLGSACGRGRETLRALRRALPCRVLPAYWSPQRWSDARSQLGHRRFFVFFFPSSRAYEWVGSAAWCFLLFFFSLCWAVSWRSGCWLRSTWAKLLLRG